MVASCMSIFGAIWTIASVIFFPSWSSFWKDIFFVHFYFSIWGPEGMVTLGSKAGYVPNRILCEFLGLVFDSTTGEKLWFTTTIVSFILTGISGVLYSCFEQWRVARWSSHIYPHVSSAWIWCPQPWSEFWES